MGDQKSELKSYVKGLVKAMNDELNSLINKNIIGPITSKIDDIDEKISNLEKRVAKVERREGNREKTASIDKDKGLEAILSEEAINLVPVHVSETMKFVLLVTSLVEGRKDYANEDVKERLINDYGEEMALSMIRQLEEALGGTRRKNLKSACKGVKKLLESG